MGRIKLWGGMRGQDRVCNNEECVVGEKKLIQIWLVCKDM